MIDMLGDYILFRLQLFAGWRTKHETWIADLDRPIYYIIRLRRSL